MTTRIRFVARFLLVLSTILAMSAAQATPIAGELFYTTFSGGTNVHKVDFNYDGLATFTLTNNIGIASVAGADGIAGNPNDPNSLFIGGQGNRIHRVSKTGVLMQTLGTPNAIYHLEVANSSTLYGSSIPSSGAFTRATINPDGSLAAPTAISITGGGSTLTQLITTPSGDYYTASGSGGFGTFGSVSIAGTIATLAPMLLGLPAAHGGTYDPFTNTIILTGDGHLTQLSLAGVILSDLVLSGGTFDQGTVDGQGHLFAANNNGDLTFIDYSASGLIGGAGSFVSTQFLAGSLDDIAPLVGAGTTNLPEPGSLALLGLGLLLIRGIGRKRF